MITIAIQRHPGIDVDGCVPWLQTWCDKISAAWSVPVVTIKAYTKRKPAHSWPVRWSSNLPAGAGGIHLDSKSTPYALVLPSEGMIAASHELFEMLVDPFGVRFTTVGARDYLVEVCDPVEARGDERGISDFVLPAWYSGGETAPMTSRLSPQPSPLVLLGGGYVSWIEDGGWYQRFKDSMGRESTQYLGPATTRTRSEKDRLAGTKAA